ncbi:DUF2849 domain-containing protein [Oceanicella sp. SM1341]|uniref:DUF2849 domain-containing protein n=1 Tax=Oceanicella sp. SM1341 TaxID=1548889 RepID=UPI000E498C05|nr:DUF2849 domain-containing protein [Oceanicella sp. SM1341]
MARAFRPVVLTANDLVEGDVVWWTGAVWSRDVSDAEVFDTPEAAEAAEAALNTPEHAACTVGIVRVEVEMRDGAPFPTLRREQIRAERRPTFDYLPTSKVSEAA